VIWLCLTMAVMVSFASLAVDLARLQVCKGQAQAAADAAALYAAEGIVGGTPAAVRARAVAAAGDNTVNGSAVVVNPNLDVSFGKWDQASRTFTLMPAGAESAATAVRVNVHCDAARGNAIPLMFAGCLGIRTADVDRTATASIGKVTSSTVPAMACPWLAGMPTGSYVPNTNGNPTPAFAGPNSPPEVDTKAGTSLRFAAISGSTSWDSTSGNGGYDTAGAGGNTGYIAGQATANGINTTYAPLNAMVGIFLDDNQPNLTAPAATLDFSTAASRDFTTLKPQLKQVFYIGSGVNSAGQLQTFVAPTGATRLFLGTMDQWGWWWDNTGSLNYTTVQGNDATLVQ
jgi:hypothetical protein